MCVSATIYVFLGLLLGFRAFGVCEGTVIYEGRRQCDSWGPRAKASSRKTPASKPQHHQNLCSSIKVEASRLFPELKYMGVGFCDVRV